MTRFRHLDIAALALVVCTVSAFAHIPRDVLEPTVSMSDICAHSSACASATADRRPFVVLVPVPSRLTRIQYHNGTSNFVDRVYTLDAHGNTTAMEINAGLLPTVAPAVKRLSQNAADELTAIQTKTNPGVQDWTDKTPVHDAEGNLISDGDSTFSYGYENRLAAVVSGSDSAAYYYAGDGSRVAAVTVESGSTNTSIFVLDYADPLRRPLAELDENGGLVRRFVWGRGVVAQVEADGTVHYFHHDGQGSTLALSDTNNVATDAWFYSPYGEVMGRTGTTDTPYQWVGGVGVRSVTVGGVYFARHRYYHAGLHRFLSQDPIGLRGGPNLYAYARGNPLFWIDPYGLCHTEGGFGYDLVGALLPVYTAPFRRDTGGYSLQTRIQMGMQREHLAGMVVQGGSAALLLQVVGPPLVEAGFGIYDALNDERPANSPPARGRHTEHTSPRPVRPEQATDEWDRFLGEGPYSDRHPRTGEPDPDRIVSPDGTRSIRYGPHEMDSRDGLHHYHEETWRYDPERDAMDVDNVIRRVPIRRNP